MGGSRVIGQIAGNGRDGAPGVVRRIVMPGVDAGEIAKRGRDVAFLEAATE
jgi:hypothetical protein